MFGVRSGRAGFVRQLIPVLNWLLGWYGLHFYQWFRTRGMSLLVDCSSIEGLNLYLKRARCQLPHAQVLMATRGGDLRTRRRALAVTHGVVGALREEYALLLPESLPFLSELLEDEDAGEWSPF